jgi:hypothetical protein
MVLDYQEGGAERPLLDSPAQTPIAIWLDCWGKSIFKINAQSCQIDQSSLLQQV